MEKENSCPLNRGKSRQYQNRAIAVTDTGLTTMENSNRFPILSIDPSAHYLHLNSPVIFPEVPDKNTPEDWKFSN